MLENTLQCYLAGVFSASRIWPWNVLVKLFRFIFKCLKTVWARFKKPTQMDVQTIKVLTKPLQTGHQANWGTNYDKIKHFRLPVRNCHFKAQRTREGMGTLFLWLLTLLTAPFTQPLWLPVHFMLTIKCMNFLGEIAALSIQIMNSWKINRLYGIT